MTLICGIAQHHSQSQPLCEGGNKSCPAGLPRLDTTLYRATLPHQRIEHDMGLACIANGSNS